MKDLTRRADYYYWDGCAGSCTKEVSVEVRFDYGYGLEVAILEQDREEGSNYAYSGHSVEKTGRSVMDWLVENRLNFSVIRTVIIRERERNSFYNDRDFSSKKVFCFSEGVLKRTYSICREGRSTFIK